MSRAPILSPLRSRSVALFVLVVALALGGCPEGEPTGDGDLRDGGLVKLDGGDTTRLVSVTLSPATAELPVGASLRMSALGRYSDGRTAQLASDVAWSSDAPAVADVGTGGADAARVTAYSSGTATIRASLGGVEGSAVITVPERAVVSLSLSPPSASLVAGRGVQLSLTAVFDDESSDDLTDMADWSSSAPAVATVDAAGAVSTHVEGDAVITASFGGVSATGEIHVLPPVVVQLSSVNKHAAVLLSNGRVLAFGHNRYGQTGVAPGQTPDTCTDDDGCAGDEVCDKNAGSYGVCSLPCAENSDCPLGDECDCVEQEGGTCTKGFCIDLVTAPTLVPGLTGVRRVVTTGFATFAILDEGRVLGFGWNAGGRVLGNDDVGGRAIERTPQPVVKRTASGSEPLKGIVDLAGGLEHAVALDEDGRVWSFGRGWLGRIGDGETTDRRAAVQVMVRHDDEDEPVPLIADAVDAGSFHSVALERGSGRVYGWGWNGVGQLGNGITGGPVSNDQGFAEPVCAEGEDGACLTGATAVAAGWAHSLALIDGRVRSWGWNSSGQLGDGSFADRYRAAAPVVSNVVGIESGFNHTLALPASGALQIWGRNSNGQLGDGTTTNREVPAALPLPGAVVDISAGSDQVLALLEDGRVYVWGWNRWGELGLGDREQRNTPTQHPTLSP